jgi:hypothetical protein
MSMRPRLLGVSALAVELDKDRRTISRLLKHTPADGRTSKGDDAWFLTTAMRALAHLKNRPALRSRELMPMPRRGPSGQECRPN